MQERLRRYSQAQPFFDQIWQSGGFGNIN